MKNWANNMWHKIVTGTGALLMLLGGVELVSAPVQQRRRMTQDMGDLNTLVARYQKEGKTAGKLKDVDILALNAAFDKAYGDGKYGKRSRAEVKNAENAIARLGYTREKLEKAVKSIDINKKRSIINRLKLASSKLRTVDELSAWLNDATFALGGYVNAHPDDLSFASSFRGAIEEAELKLAELLKASGKSKELDPEVPISTKTAKEYLSETMQALAKVYNQIKNADLGKMDEIMKYLLTSKQNVETYMKEGDISEDDKTELSAVAQYIIPNLALMITARETLATDEVIGAANLDFRGGSTTEALNKKIVGYINALAATENLEPEMLDTVLNKDKILTEVDKALIKQRAEHKKKKAVGPAAGAAGSAGSPKPSAPPAPPLPSTPPPILPDADGKPVEYKKEAEEAVAKFSKLLSDAKGSYLNEVAQEIAKLDDPNLYKKWLAIGTALLVAANMDKDKTGFEALITTLAENVGALKNLINEG